MNIINYVYLELIVKGKMYPQVAIHTDHIKAILRDEISKLSGVDSQIIQDHYEALAMEQIRIIK